MRENSSLPRVGEFHVFLLYFPNMAIICNVTGKCFVNINVEIHTREDFILHQSYLGFSFCFIFSSSSLNDFSSTNYKENYRRWFWLSNIISEQILEALRKYF